MLYGKFASGTVIVWALRPSLGDRYGGRLQAGGVVLGTSSLGLATIGEKLQPGGVTRTGDVTSCAGQVARLG